MGRDCIWPRYRAAEAEMDSSLFVHLLVPYAPSFSPRGCLSKETSQSVSCLSVETVMIFKYCTNTLFCQKINKSKNKNIKGAGRRNCV